MTAATGRAAWGARLAGRLPRRTIRLRLTLLYGVLFLVSGAALLGLTYLLVASNLPMQLRVSGSAQPLQLRRPGSLSSRRRGSSAAWPWRICWSSPGSRWPS